MKDPNKLLSDQDIAIIRQQSAKCEQQGGLSQEMLELIYQNQWLQVMEPKSVNGLEWEFPQIVRLFESLSWADGNVGWCVNLGAGANMFSGYLEQGTAQQIFNSEKICCAGSGAISGTAVQVKNGFLISGKWKYASGSAHATHFTANCFLMDDQNKPILEQGKHIFKSFIFPREKVRVMDTWHVVGLKATSSNDFEVEGLFVPEACSFSLLKPSEHAVGPLFKFPFDLLAVVNMAIVPIGITLHFIDLFQDLMAYKKPLHGVGYLKDNEQLQLKFKKETEQFYQLRNELYQKIDQVWTYFMGNEIPDGKYIADLKVLARDAAFQSRILIMELFPFCGMSIIYEDAAINKVWRDLSVAMQHYLLSPLNMG